jgi:hypothetical protein
MVGFGRCRRGAWLVAASCVATAACVLGTLGSASAAQTPGASTEKGNVSVASAHKRGHVGQHNMIALTGSSPGDGRLFVYETPSKAKSKCPAISTLSSGAQLGLDSEVLYEQVSPGSFSYRAKTKVGKSFYHVDHYCAYLQWLTRTGFEEATGMASLRVLGG